MKKAFLLFVMLLLGILTVSAVSALQVTLNHVWVDGTEVYESGTNSIRALDKNEQLPVKVEFTVDNNLTDSLHDVQVEAVIRGYDQSDLIQDITEAFTAQQGVTYDKNLDLKLPIRMDQDRYALRVRIEDRDGSTTEATYELEVESQSHAMWIKDVMLSPSDAVIAGRALLARVRVQNIGTQDETDGLKVTFAIPNLGISDANYIDHLDMEETTTSEDLYVRIPACVQEGLYNWFVTVTYHNGDETATVTGKIMVQQGDVCPTSTDQPAQSNPVTIISVGAGSQAVVNGGSEVMYPITITNQEGAAKTYLISVDSGDWATFTISPSNMLLLQKGETGTIFVHAQVSKNAPAGDNLFVVNVKKGAELIKQVSLKVNVVQTTQKPTQTNDGWDAVKKGLLVALIVLIIILIIIGLVIGFRKVRSDEETGEKGESYY